MTRVRLALTLTVWLAVVLALWASDSRPAVAVIGGIVVAGAAACFAALDLGRGLVRAEWRAEVPHRPAPAADDPRVGVLRHRVQAAWLTGSTQVGDTLVDLVDDRLRAHHHIDRATHPQVAHDLLSPTLRRLLAGPRRQTATPGELQRILTDIEAL